MTLFGQLGLKCDENMTYYVTPEKGDIKNGRRKK